MQFVVKGGQDLMLYCLTAGRIMNTDPLHGLEKGLVRFNRIPHTLKTAYQWV